MSKGDYGVKICELHNEEKIKVGVVDSKYRCRSCRKEKETPLYSSLQTTKQRCTNPNVAQWKDYGGRGISFHWKSIKEAERWIIENLGPRPDGMWLDRIDNDGNYEPGNLRWATPLEQKQNRRGHCATCTCEIS